MKEAVGLYLKMLKKEASFYKGMSVSTIYIGGGTPTYLDKGELEFLFEAIHSHFKTDGALEWTVEANPATFDLEKAYLLREQGVSRVSLGIQSFNEDFLKYLGRAHTKQDALKSYDFLREAGFNNLNIDLMYGFSHQGEKELDEDISEALALRPEHISLYGLTVSRDSVFYKQGVKSLDDDVQAEFYRMICENLAQKGLAQYEVSNFAKRGHESRHNLNYWQGGDYIGLGISAHSHFDGARSWNTSDLTQYAAMIDEGILPFKEREVLPPEKKFLEVLLIGLRMKQGVDVAHLEARFGVTLDKNRKGLIESFIKRGLLERHGNGRDSCLRASLSGMMVLDEICARII